jgi:predicted phosphodiesterase
MLTIEMIGSIDRQTRYSPADVKALLQANVQALITGTDFIGRPGTHIYANISDVLKVRTELDMGGVEALAWIQHALEKERLMGVYHPHKTWLLITGSGAGVMIANICPRLKPLHAELNIITDPQPKLEWLKAVFRLYLVLAKTTGDKLDEGLSNFAVSEQGQVYYLDDEYYAWDDFASLSVMLGVYIRNFAWLDAEFIIGLGNSLAEIVQDVFEDASCRYHLAEQLHSLFMPNPEKQQLADLLIKALRQPLPARVAPIPNTSRPDSGRFFALLGDIHANYPALSRVLDYLDGQGIRQGIVLGDIVGYGPDPAACIERLQASSLQVIKGNHDHGVATGDTGKGFSANSRMVINWTANELSAAHRDWLGALPAFIQSPDWLAVHGAPMDAEYFYAYVYEMTYEDNLDYMQTHHIALCLHGHSHTPGVYARDKRHQDSRNTAQTINLPDYQHTLLCPGSVGQPRNGRTETQFAVYDREQASVTFMALPYDNTPTIDKMREHNFPDALWQRLLSGR